MKQVSVLFVCMGNICRSPTAEGLFRQAVEKAGLAKHIEIDSAGTHSYHVGSQPDARAQAASLKRGIDLSALRGRQAQSRDFTKFDYILAMDNSNYTDLMQLAGGSASNLHMFLDFSDRFSETDVPDPYYGGDQGFEHVLDLIEDASKGLLVHIQKNSRL